MLRRKTLNPRSRGDGRAKRALATPESGKSAQLALVESKPDPSEQDSTPCHFGKGAVEGAYRVARIRKRRRDVIEEPLDCGGGEPPCYQHLLGGL